MFLRFSVTYSSYNDPDKREMNREIYAALYPFLNKDGQPFTEATHIPGYLHEDVIADPNELQAALAPFPGYELKLKRFSNNCWVGITEALSKYTYSSTLKPGSVDGVNVTHVHIPNLGLLTMDEVRLLSDACTDELQGALDEGWRIIAVCPPGGQRRPDYIMGRTQQNAHS